ncbi:uncharacterized protein B0T23DRAFT_407960 [Neurospora hispaniola]|uniref:Uncharacterized protein n=1 Tax=Neurospora hispaniola TaxID=588809 RepID=A0AAJ0I009_9PEZI|nr:hypothetical protein B0T23DRAFT_407960 [Neurospora hispaniola]
MTQANKSFCSILEVINDLLNAHQAHPLSSQHYVVYRVSTQPKVPIPPMQQVISLLEVAYYGIYSALLLATKNGEVQGQWPRWLSTEFTSFTAYNLKLSCFAPS